MLRDRTIEAGARAHPTDLLEKPMFPRPLRALVAPILLVGALLPHHAEAADGLVWTWEGERRYQIKADLQLNEWMFLRARNNADVRISEIQIGVDTVCASVSKVGKKAFELNCRLEDVQLLASTVGADSGKILPILDELEEQYRLATVNLVFTEDGRIRNIGLDGLDKRNRRINEIQETMRLLIARVFASFDLQLPKKGDDGGKAWKQQSLLSMSFPSTFGTMGAAEVRSEVVKTEGSVVEVMTKGTGTLGPAEMITVGAGAPERPKNLYELELRGLATFDTQQGTLLERQYMVDGMPTPSSLAAEAGAGVSYVQAVRLVLIPEGEAPPPLGPNAETDPRRAL